MAWQNDYVDVATRLQLFYEKHPDGVIQCMPAEIKTVGDKQFIAVMAYGYKTPDDAMPYMAQAWEPAVGSTNFTRNSECMNAETSAVGRMLGMMGIAAKKSIASRDEVSNRVNETDPQPESKAFTALMEIINKAETQADLEAAAKLIKTSNCSEANLKELRNTYWLKMKHVQQ
jgi:hypothetical protein